MSFDDDADDLIKAILHTESEAKLRLYPELNLRIWNLLGGKELPAEAIPNYTWNLHAALGLIPTGWVIHSVHAGREQRGIQVWNVSLCLNDHADIEVDASCPGPTMAKAICMAALRAWKIEQQKALDSVT